jgi:hypothetical protein
MGSKANSRKDHGDRKSMASEDLEDKPRRVGKTAPVQEMEVI